MRRQQFGLGKLGFWWLWTDACLRNTRDCGVKINKGLNLKAGCRTTATGIMLHTDVEEVLEDGDVVVGGETIEQREGDDMAGIIAICKTKTRG